MKTNYKLTTVILITLFLNIYSFAQAPALQWQKSFGGTNDDLLFSIDKTLDGGYILAGATSSNDGDVTGFQGSSDYWIVKLNAIGNIEWQKTFGGAGYDRLFDINQTTDGGYILIGNTSSVDGDVTLNYGSTDCWILKLNSNGTIQWTKIIGGSNTENGLSIQQTNDGGYIIAGDTYSNDFDVIGNHGINDFLIVKLSSVGNIQWQKTLGGTGYDTAVSIKITIDGGYIVTGYVESNNGNVSGNHGGVDFWVVKLNSIGDIQWQKTLGGTGLDYAKCIQQTNDGGYIVTGLTYSNDGDVIGNHGNSDYWVVKLSSIGNIQWQKTLGGTDGDLTTDIIQTVDGGYLVSGYTNSNNGDVIGNHGNTDSWIVKLGSTGIIQWQKTLGGTNTDIADSIQQTSDGGYIIAGESNSNNGDVTGNQGGRDFWIVKLAPVNLSNNSFIENTTITLFPNPAKEKINLKLNYFSPSQEIYITDILGKIIHNQKLEGLSTTINTINFEKGIYFLNLKDGSKTTTKKFIVE